MPYQNRTKIVVPSETKKIVREAKEDLGMSYREFLEQAADELTD